MRALIVGISGQDGTYLAELLLRKGYEVFGTSRDAEQNGFGKLTQLGIRDRVTLLSVAPHDFRSVLYALSETQPDEIYNLSGQSSVALSFAQPVETMDSIAGASMTLLEAIRAHRRPVHFYNSSSGECFGDTAGIPATEETAFRPRSPYAVAKSAAHFQVANYREAYGLFACSGILFNHESPLRPERFVTRKIVSAACRIAAGSRETLRLGNTRVKRDWGWAPEYVEAMWRMLQQPVPADYLVATGETRSLEEFVELAFREVGLDWRAHVRLDESQLRPTDIGGNYALPEKAERVLGWRATIRMEEVVRRMVAAQKQTIQGSTGR